MYRTLIILLMLMASALTRNPLARAEEYRYTVTVRFDTAKLELTDSSGTLLDRFPVALPAYFTPRDPIYGAVGEIRHRPVWYPTEKTRAASDWKLPAVVPPWPHPHNAMGVGAIIIRYSTRWWGMNDVVIHGTNQPEKIGLRVSRGCIRMKNEDWLALSKRIGAAPTRIIFTPRPLAGAPRGAGFLFTENFSNDGCRLFRPRHLMYRYTRFLDDSVVSSLV